MIYSDHVLKNGWKSMGLDQYIEKYDESKCKKRIDINEYIIDGVLDSDKLVEDGAMDINEGVVVDSCYWRKQPWVQEFIGRKLGRDIENCKEYVINKDVVTDLLAAYNTISLALTPYYDGDYIECVGVPDDVQTIVREAVGPGIFREGAILSEDTLGQMMNGIRGTRFELERILYEMKNENATFFYMGWW